MILADTTFPATLPVNTEFPITCNSIALDDESIKLPVIVWSPTNELLPNVAPVILPDVLPDTMYNVFGLVKDPLANAA